ncbi:MAG: hypothetical protein HY825_16930 [Acidobacteria bacterium]|nr:hypothetical protein [Acidobacteriota bacterium]
MPEARADTRLVPLVCPTCGADLDGLPGDRVFGCAECARAYSVEAVTLRESPLVAWEADGTAPDVYLPIWVFEVEATLVLPPRRASRAPGAPQPGERLVPFPERFVYVTAFELLGRTRFGDPGLHMTRRQPAVKVARGNAPRLRGATVGRAAAEELVTPTILSVADAREDVLGARVDLRIVRAALALAPFGRREDGGVVEPFGGVGYPPAALPDLAGVRG